MIDRHHPLLRLRQLQEAGKILWRTENVFEGLVVGIAVPECLPVSGRRRRCRHLVEESLSQVSRGFTSCEKFDDSVPVSSALSYCCN